MATYIRRAMSGSRVASIYQYHLIKHRPVAISKSLRDMAVVKKKRRRKQKKRNQREKIKDKQTLACTSRLFYSSRTWTVPLLFYSWLQPVYIDPKVECSLSFLDPVLFSCGLGRLLHAQLHVSISPVRPCLSAGLLFGCSCSCSLRASAVPCSYSTYPCNVRLYITSLSHSRLFYLFCSSPHSLSIISIHLFALLSLYTTLVTTLVPPSK